MPDLKDILSDKPLDDIKPAEQPEPKPADAATERPDAKADVKPQEAKGEKPEDAKAAADGASPAPAQDGEQGGLKQALDAERSKRKDWKEKALRFEGEIEAMRRELAALKQPTQTPQQGQDKPAESDIPDPLLDPKGYGEYVAAEAERRAINYTLNASEAKARAAHGAELVDAAFEWAKTHVFPQNPNAFQQLIREADPYDVLVKVYQRNQRFGALAADPEKWEQEQRAKIREELLADIAAGKLANPSGQPAPTANPPPSLANVRSAASRSTPGYSGPTPLSSIVQ